MGRGRVEMPCRTHVCATINVRMQHLKHYFPQAFSARIFPTQYKLNGTEFHWDTEEGSNN